MGEEIYKTDEVVITVGHFHQDMIEKAVKQFLRETGNNELAFVVKFRHYNQEILTDEPGNTCLFTSFASCRFNPIHIKDDKKLLSKLIANELNKGDHLEEFEIFEQNNELMIVLSLNK